MKKFFYFLLFLFLSVLGVTFTIQNPQDVFDPVLLGVHLAWTADHCSFGQFGDRNCHRLFGWVGKEFKVKKKIFWIGEIKMQVGYHATRIHSTAGCKDKNLI